MASFEYIVVGAGLIGSAAARYLTALSKQVAMIGSPEPFKQKAHKGVFASHYDQRRLTRLSGRSKLWVDIAKRATEQIHYLEKESGIAFFEPVGVLVARADHLKDKYSESPEKTLKEASVAHRYYPASDKSWRNDFPDFYFPESHSVLHEAKTAGMLNPRKLIKAQLELAKNRGLSLFETQVTGLHETEDGFELNCSDGSMYQAKKVLVCAGAFTNFNNLLPKKLALTLKTETILLAEVSAKDAAMLKAIPTVSYSIEHSQISDIYLTPPVKYEDGKFYFKLGANTFLDTFPSRLEEVQAWFRSGDSDACLAVLMEAIQSILPKIKFLSFKTKRCIITRTASTFPIIDRVSENLFVASGGNGVGAKTSDTLGYLAAGLSHNGHWPSSIDREPFKALFES